MSGFFLDCNWAGNFAEIWKPCGALMIYVIKDI